MKSLRQLGGLSPVSSDSNDTPSMSSGTEPPVAMAAKVHEPVLSYIFDPVWLDRRAKRVTQSQNGGKSLAIYRVVHY